jgi:hypothetical protein
MLLSRLHHRLIINCQDTGTGAGSPGEGAVNFGRRLPAATSGYARPTIAFGIIKWPADDSKNEQQIPVANDAFIQVDTLMDEMEPSTLFRF